MSRENLADLVAFITVARERNFTRAAAKLGVSQSALSRTIQGMEERVGLLLLTRTTRSVAPTEAGQRLLSSIAPKLDEIDAELDGLNELRETPTGTVRITSTEYATAACVWPKLSPLLSEHRGIHVELINDYELRNIVEQRFDLGIRLGDQIERDMIAARIGPDVTMAIVGAPSYLAQHAPPKSPQDLTRHSCINLWLPSRQSRMPWELQKGRREISVRVEGQMVFNTAYQMVAAAAAGHGLAYVPKDLAEDAVRQGQLRWVLEDWYPTFTGFHVYYSSRRKPSRAVDLVIQALKEDR